jgi:23S rRNA (adenine2503-C2)-methyltransferase|nr:23S rRNA (adenine(2503)-C(2))-methyltransferase RlmN [Candidatus Krumholzibacteria bacterium]
MKPLIRSLVPAELARLVAESGLPPFRLRQLSEWLYPHAAWQWDTMSNLPRNLRDRLAQDFDLAGLELQERQVSEDRTRKFLFRLRDGSTIESVIIPTGDHPTFCLSTQVGCAMACRFCATARGGLVRNLEPGEIIEQIQRLEQDLKAEPVPGLGGKQHNVVFMGMGEPLDNWPAMAASLEIMTHEQALGLSRRRIQISTSGPREGLELLLAAAPGVGLTLSLGGSDDAERKKVMPVPGRTPVTEAVDLAARYAKVTGRRATLAWVLIKGSTDKLEQAARLVKLARRGNFKVNLIPLNPLDDIDLERPEEKGTLAFQEVLTAAGIDTFIRLSGGRDIAAACGQLRRRRGA